MNNGQLNMAEHTDKKSGMAGETWVSPTALLLEKHNAGSGTRSGKSIPTGLYSSYFSEGKRKSLTTDFVSHKQQWLEHQSQIQNLYRRRLSIEYERLLGSKYLDLDADFHAGETARDKSKLGRSHSFSSRKDTERRYSTVSERSALVPLTRQRSFTLPESVLGPMLRLRDLTLEEGKRKLADSRRGREGEEAFRPPEVRLVKDLKELDLGDYPAGELTDTSPSSDASLEVSRMLRGGSPIHRRYCTNGSTGVRHSPLRQELSGDSSLPPHSVTSPTINPLLLSPTRNRRTARPSSPTLSAVSLSPGPIRKRSNTFSGKPGEDGLLCFSPPRSPQHIPRDPIQPSRGSISDLSDRFSCDETDEEMDQFPLVPIQRPRARTCPENRAWKRRAKRNINNRPPTPPPMSISPVTGLSEAQMSILLTKEKLRIQERPLQIVPEDNKDPGSYGQSAFRPWEKHRAGTSAPEAWTCLETTKEPSGINIAPHPGLSRHSGLPGSTIHPHPGLVRETNNNLNKSGGYRETRSVSSPEGQ